MKNKELVMKAYAVVAISITAFFNHVAAAGETSISDPIADYLAMQVPDRSEYVGTLELIKRVKIDVDGDGNNEIFIGRWYRQGRKKGVSPHH